MRRLALLLAASACLSGCEGPSVFSPLPERIHAAFPLPDEVELARSRLVAALEADRKTQEAATRQFDQLLAVRALACTAGNPVGRFDSVAKIREKVTDKACFAKHDAQLEEWIAVRRIGLLLRAPALVPAAELPARTLLPNTAENIASAHLAAQANVLVVRSHQQRFHAFEIPTNKELASFNATDGYSRTPSLSPNGRLVAAGSGKVLRFFEVETGRPLWSTDKYQDVIAWGPQWDMVVLTQAGTGAPQMLDTRTGVAEPYPSSEKRLSWALPTADGQLLVGNYNSASLVQHTRQGDGPPQAKPVRQWTFTNAAVLNGTPFLVNQGRRLVFPHNRDLNWLDLATGQQGSWQVSLLNPSGFGQVGDSVIAFDSTPPGAVATTTRLLDTDKGTLATATESGDRGQIYSLSPRTGLLRRSANAVTLVGALQGEQPQDLERVISEFLLAREIAKLNDPYRPDFQAVPNDAGLSPERRAMMKAHAEAYARDLQAPHAQAQMRAGTSAYQPVVPVAKPILDVPADATIAMLGVYQPKGGNVGGRRTAAPITVRVGPGSKPIVLVLASYEAVTWMIQPGSRKIAAVLLSGYTPSSVHGQGPAQVVRIGSRYAYKFDSPEFQELRRDVARYVGNTTPVFQGGYEGSDFQVQ